MAPKMKKKAVVIHSGGMDSSICLALAIEKHGRENVLSLSFFYNQRHTEEVNQAALISKDWKVDHIELPIDCLQEITESALIGKSQAIQHDKGKEANTLVVGRNGLMIRLASIHAHFLGAKEVYTGVIELDGKANGYRDCTREYVDLLEKILRMDFDDDSFEIKTPLVFLTKKETLEVAHQMGLLDYLLQNTITCYEGVKWAGCKKCPSCLLRNQGLKEFKKDHPEFQLPFSLD
ncbi:7-cyano-7-deazaguanine synthase [Criblamydia sequanensis CRIB-18]|uniref:7-cyano-7-deazaguanine synthase n=2 Tax=Candidatus Criblamydia sequanensis TaxID=340071 RepID=A0A090D1S4_9BACT|nr:7-cyano-7-deazaguanine synthase [Criblamydia sequanensis CRIB-18]